MNHLYYRSIEQANKNQMAIMIYIERYFDGTYFKLLFILCAVSDETDIYVELRVVVFMSIEYSLSSMSVNMSMQC